MTLPLDTLHLHPNLTPVREAFASLGITEAWWVGGMVRDALLAPEAPLSPDWDVALPHTHVAELAPKLAELLHATLVPLDESWGIYRLVLPQTDAHGHRISLDCVAVQAPTMADDLLRRDLSINALALHLHTGQCLDPTGGLADLQARRLRHLSDANLVDDPLRVLRVYRFLAQLKGFRVDETTRLACQRYAHTLPTAAAERINQEFSKLLAPTPPQGQVALAVQAMADDGVLEALLPELTACRQVPANSHHHLPLWQHTLELVHQLDTTVWPRLPEATRTALQHPSGAYGNALGLVRLGCLLHDIGKPATWTVDPDTQRHRFIGHEREGEEMAKTRLKALKHPSAAIHTVAQLVRWHLYPCAFSSESSAKSVLRFYRRMGDNTPLLIALALADTLSTCGVERPPTVVEASVQAMLGLLEQYHQQAEVLASPPLLSGHQVMTLLHLSPSPAVGRWLAHLAEAQQLGIVSTTPEAETWLRSHPYASAPHTLPALP
jgi:putative nucleotidyltransferase with HDIG domain